MYEAVDPLSRSLLFRGKNCPDPRLTNVQTGHGTFPTDGCIPDTVNGKKFIRDLYELVDDKIGAILNPNFVYIQASAYDSNPIHGLSPHLLPQHVCLKTVAQVFLHSKLYGFPKWDLCITLLRTDEARSLYSAAVLTRDHPLRFSPNTFSQSIVAGVLENTHHWTS